MADGVDTPPLLLMSMNLLISSCSSFELAKSPILGSSGESPTDRNELQDGPFSFFWGERQCILQQKYWALLSPVLVIVSRCEGYQSVKMILAFSMSTFANIS
uniref:Uncharacterized protein n=1 Tax=Lepeophtheirus salmonis TaxID=72036 RepID=A0A0K2TYJ3_LEPSM